MKKQFSLLAICVCGISLAQAQTTTTTYSTTTTTSSPAYATDTTNAMNGSSVTMTDSSSNGMQTNTVAPSNRNTTNSVNDPGTTTTTTTTETYSTTDAPARTKRTKGYQNFAFGIYAGANTTRFKGESVNTNGGDLSGRVGYQAGFFVRAGGRVFGQIGAEYFASSSNYFTPGDGQSAQNIQDQINIKYIQVPVYVGYKLLQSDRGVSAVRLQVGLEYANRINSTSGKFNLSNDEIKSGTFNGLGQLGFDIGPLLIDLTYHYGFDQSIQAVQSSGFAGSQRRILSASVGFKF